MYYDVLQKTPIKKPTQAIVILIFQWITTGITIEIAYPPFSINHCLVYPLWYFQIFITNLAKTSMSCRLPETCWEVVSHSDWQTWRSCQTKKYFAGPKKKSPKKFTVMCIMFCLGFLECFTLVLAIGHLISPLVFIEVKVIQFLVFSVVQNCICYVFYSVCLEFCCFDDLVL
jgi:hypothetical protein